MSTWSSEVGCCLISLVGMKIRLNRILEKEEETLWGYIACKDGMRESAWRRR